MDIRIKTIEEAYKEVDERCAAVIQFPLSDKGLLDTSLLRITVCKAVGKASAFASKKIITVANVDGSEILSSDFNPQWCKVEFNSEVFDIIHSKYPAAIEGWSKERINDEILH
ncbi:MAG: hypothetical protein JNL74_00380 [Fibrobacteres bacterium]|nr:hypothetical protein [Fibrobacterota bacterium]